MARELLQIGVTLPEFLRAFAALAPHALEHGVGEEIARAYGRSGDLSGDVHGEAEVHEAHGGHLERPAPATCAGYKYAAGTEDHALGDGDFGFVDGGEGGAQFLEDHGPVRRVA